MFPIFKRVCVHQLRLHCKYKITFMQFLPTYTTRIFFKIGGYEVNYIWNHIMGSLAILIGIMLEKNEDNSTQSNIAHTGNSVQQGYVYTADTLRSIKGQVDHDRQFKILNPQTCNTIRKLRLNRKKTRRGKKVKAQKIHQKRSVELENLITIQCKRESKIKRQNTNLHITLANVQCLKPKELLCLDHIVGNNTDLCILTETWLKNEDSIWLQGCKLNKNGWKIFEYTQRRQNRRWYCTSVQIQI